VGKLAQGRLRLTHAPYQSRTSGSFPGIHSYDSPIYEKVTLNSSDDSVPGEAALGPSGSESLADVLYGVGHCDLGKILRALAAELTGQAETNGSAVRYGKLLAVHPVCEQRLRMPSIDHIDVIPLPLDAAFVHRVKVGVEPKEHDILRLGEGSDQIQNVGKTDSGPLGNEGPTFFADRPAEIFRPKLLRFGNGQTLTGSTKQRHASYLSKTGAFAPSAQLEWFTSPRLRPQFRSCIPLGLTRSPQPESRLAGDLLKNTCDGLRE
jgi:hypothetical protein